MTLTASIPMLTAPTSLADVLTALKSALCIDECLMASMGYGLATKYAPAWSFITGGNNDPYSDLWHVDGFGRIEVCRRSQWDAKAAHYDHTTTGRTKIRLNKPMLTKLTAAIGERTKGMYLYRCGSTNCWSTKPWTH